MRAPDWRDRVAGGTELTVGLVWAGDPNHARDRHRSISLATVGPATQVEGTRWFSLQKGSAAGALMDSPFNRTIVDLEATLREYADTAAAIEALDLVVTVDTSVAHLAGALGKPVWVLLPSSADWRWMEAREDSPWYPTMRLFRQRVAGDWSEAVARVIAALELEVSKRSGRRNVDQLIMLDKRQPMVAGEPTGYDAVPVPRIANACRARVGMIQYMGGPESSARSIAYYGEYLQQHIDVLERLVTKGDVIAEVGAGIGLHSIALASMVAPDGQLIALENSPVLRRVLRQNLAGNGVRGVSVVNGTLVGQIPRGSGSAETDRPETLRSPSEDVSRWTAWSWTGFSY